VNECGRVSHKLNDERPVSGAVEAWQNDHRKRIPSGHSANGLKNKLNGAGCRSVNGVVKADGVVNKCAAEADPRRAGGTSLDGLGQLFTSVENICVSSNCGVSQEPRRSRMMRWSATGSRATSLSQRAAM
jgi:hypothetical protein